MRVFIYLIFFLFVSSKLEANIPILKWFEANIEVPNILNIQNCTRWHVDFTQPKTTVYYMDKLITMGKYGGFLCIDPSTFSLDQKLAEKLNGDFYTNVIVRDDTLIAEKFNNLYYLNSDTLWADYELEDPILLFNIVFEDDEYCFYSTDDGEWGGTLYVYNKFKKETSIIGQEDYYVSSILKINNEYIISRSLKSGYWFVPHYRIPVKKLESQSIENIILDYKEVGRHRFTYPESVIPPRTNNFEFVRDSILFYEKDNYTFISSTKMNAVKSIQNNNNLHFDFSNIEQIDEVTPDYKSGFQIIKGDTIIKVNLNMIPSFKLTEKYDLNTPHHNVAPYFSLLNHDLEYTNIPPKKINCETINWSDEDKIISRKLFFKLNSKNSIVTFINDSIDQKLLIGKNLQCKLPFNESIIEYCFKFNGNYYLGFSFHGWRPNYGLVEITNLDSFIEVYCK